MTSKKSNVRRCVTMILLIQVLCIGVVVSCPVSNPLVNTKKGLIRGLRSSDGAYNMFLGIPYARVNKSNPFGLSLPYPDFDEVYEANDDSTMCPQLHEFSGKVLGTLDCLRINIYVPNVATDENMAVMVWIYGGGFQTGYATTELFGPKFLVMNGVILITFNYRVGPYGFMSLDTPEIPGNQGFKDQILALRWIRDNIKSFGGDPERVTLFGESAGSMSIDFHLLYAQEKLFDKAIMQSGTAMFPFSVASGDKEAPKKIAKRMGFQTDSNDEAIAFLTTQDPKAVVQAAGRMIMYFDPCIEKEFEGVERFITEHPINRAIPDTMNRTLMMGFNNNEFMNMYVIKSPQSYKYMNVFFHYLNKTFNFDDIGDQVRLVRRFYIGDEVPSKELKQNLMDYESDFIFIYPVYRSMQAYLAKGFKVYNYLFSYSGKRNYAKTRSFAKDDGAAHADEVGYLFDVQILFKKEPTEEEQLMILRLTKLWTNFAKYGDPTPETTDLLPVKWIPAESNMIHSMHIDKEFELKKRPFHSRMAFWDLFYAKNLHLIRGYVAKDEKKN